VTGAAQAIGWLLPVSVVQAGIVAGIAWLAFRALPPERIRARHGIAMASLAVVTAAFLATAGALLLDWAAHVSCWSRYEADGGAVAAECRSHGVPVEEARAAVGAPEKADAVLAWAPAADVPALPRSRGLARRWTEGAGPAGVLTLVALLLLGVREVRSRRSIRRTIRDSRPVDDRETMALLDDLAAEIGVRGRVEIRESDAVGTPCVVGCRWPVILFPTGLLAALDPLELRGVLAHELAHVQRRDTFTIQLQRAAELLLFFNPFVPKISEWIRAEREAACDRVGARLGTRSRTGYVEALLVLEGLRSVPRTAGGALPLLGESELVARMRRLLSAPAAPRRPHRSALLLLLAVLATLFGGALARTTLTMTALGSWAIMAEDNDHREARPD
jgi:Zn-dependent protease with chaperone function